MGTVLADIVFEDTVKTCEFYSSEEYPVHVNRDIGCVVLGCDEFRVTPVVEDDGVVLYYVEEPSGRRRLVADLDDYFQAMLPDWREEP